MDKNFAKVIHSGRNTNPHFPKRRLISHVEKNNSGYKKEPILGKRKKNECSFCHVSFCANISTYTVLVKLGYFRLKKTKIDHFISS